MVLCRRENWAFSSFTLIATLAGQSLSLAAQVLSGNSSEVFTIYTFFHISHCITKVIFKKLFWQNVQIFFIFCSFCPSLILTLHYCLMDWFINLYSIPSQTYEDQVVFDLQIFLHCFVWICTYRNRNTGQGSSCPNLCSCRHRGLQSQN